MKEAYRTDADRDHDIHLTIPSRAVRQAGRSNDSRYRTPPLRRLPGLAHGASLTLSRVWCAELAGTVWGRRFSGDGGDPLTSIYRGIVVDFVALLSFRPSVPTAERDGRWCAAPRKYRRAAG